MKKITSLILAMTLFILTMNAQTFNWAYSSGGPGWDDLKSSHLGNDNGTVVTGMYSNTIVLGTTTLVSMAYQDAFVAKYNQNGQVIWARSISGNEQDWGYKVTTDNNNNVYVTGYFQSTALYFTPNDSIVKNIQSGRNVFLAKYNSNGVFQWARLGSGGTTETYATGFSVTTDNNNNVIIGGLYTKQIEFSGTSLPFTNATNIFLVKFDTNGNLLWAKEGASSSICWFTDLCCDASNNIYVTGKLSTPVTFGSTTVTGYQGDDVIVGKFNPSGNLLWMKVEGKPNSATTTANSLDCGTSIKVDAGGNVFIGGSFVDTFYYDFVSMTNIIKQSAFVAKYNNSGVLQWMKKFGDDEKDIINAIDLDANGNVYVIGTYRNAFTVGTFPLPLSGATSSFVAKFNSLNGNTEFAYQNGQSFDHTEGWGIGVNQLNGKIYTCGIFRSSTNFGTNTINCQGVWDMYLTLLDNSVIPSNLQAVNENLFSFYPNPSTQFIYLETTATSHLNKATITIYDALGKTMYKNSIRDKKIDISFLNPGNYFIKVDDHQSQLTKQFIKL